MSYTITESSMLGASQVPIPRGGTCPKGDVQANPDGSCPQGYQPDPNSAGCCKPVAQSANIPTITNPESWSFAFETWSTTQSDLTGKTSSFAQILPTMYDCNNSSGTLTDDGMAGTPSATVASGLITLGYKVQAVCQAGAGNNGTDSGIIAIITDSPSGTQQAFITAMINACKNLNMVGFNLDWEPGTTLQPSTGKSPYTSALTSFLQNAATQMHNAGFILTFEVSAWYSIGAYGGDNSSAWVNLADIAATPIDMILDMSYTCSLSTVTSDIDFMLANIPASKLCIIFITNDDTSPNCSDGGTNPFAQSAVEAVQNNNIPCLALWPSNFWDTTGISPSTSTWFSLCASFMAKTYPPT